MGESSTLGKYQLLKKLAVGGMAEAFLARQSGLAGFSKFLVLKRILPGLAGDQEFVTMFLDEARLAAGMSHPNVVQIFDLGEAEGTWFIAMEYIAGPASTSCSASTRSAGSACRTSCPRASWRASPRASSTRTR